VRLCASVCALCPMPCALCPTPLCPLLNPFVTSCPLLLAHRFILQTLGDGSTLSSRLATFPASAGAHKPPCCCLPRWEMGADFVTKCRTGVFQYVVVRFSTSLLAGFLFSVGLHQEGQFGITRPYVWLTFVNCCSQSYALYSLLLFYFW
jgi:hypothetical protein